MAEFVHWQEILGRGFTEWYANPPSARESKTRWREANMRARLFSDFVHQARTVDGKAVAYLNTVPAYWSGDHHALHDLHYYVDALTIGRRRASQLRRLYVLTVELLKLPGLFDTATRAFRQRRLAGANSIVLVSIAVDPQYQRLQLPSRLIARAKDTAKRLGLKYVISPFRPNAYGAFKAERRATHSAHLFEEYCGLQTPEGLPQDPWMRVLARNGVQFLQPVPRSYRVVGSLERFDDFRRIFKPESWYSPAPDTWECGETPTWYVDRFKKAVMSVEPNIWGSVTL
jgi:GNAT superfamily N-acetyltransferase